MPQLWELVVSLFPLQVFISLSPHTHCSYVLVFLQVLRIGQLPVENVIPYNNIIVPNG